MGFSNFIVSQNQTYLKFVEISSEYLFTQYEFVEISSEYVFTRVAILLRFEFFAKCERFWPIFREISRKLRKK